MKVTCPSCRLTIAAQDIALDTGWAKCASCDEVFSLADLLPGYAKAKGGDLVVPERPFDAWSILRRDEGRLVIHQPAHGVRAATIGLLAFATFWLAFIAFWTAGALGFLFQGGKPQPVNVLFACFSIPFWLVGFGMLAGALWMARGSRSLSIDAVQLATELRCMAFRRTRVLERDQVQCARLGTPLTSKEGQPPVPFVEVVFTKGSFKLPADSEAERTWLIAEINDFLQQVPYDPTHRDVLDRNLGASRFEIPSGHPPAE